MTEARYRMRIGIELEDRLMDPASVAERLGITIRTVRAMRTDGRVPGVRIGNAWRFSEKAIEAIAVNGTPSAGA